MLQMRMVEHLPAACVAGLTWPLIALMAVSVAGASFVLGMLAEQRRFRRELEAQRKELGGPWTW